MKTKPGIIIRIIYETKSNYNHGTRSIIKLNMLLGNNISLMERQKQYCIQVSNTKVRDKNRFQWPQMVDLGQSGL